jgi:hypothetical protein
MTYLYGEMTNGKALGANFRPALIEEKILRLPQNVWI